MGKSRGKGMKKQKEAFTMMPTLIQAHQLGEILYKGRISPSRNLGTGRPTIQCTACGEYTHWRRGCPFDNYCTTMQ